MERQRCKKERRGGGGATELKSQIPIWSGNECGEKALMAIQA